MKKSLILLPAALLALASCNNTEDLLFADSAAERLELSKADAKQALTADGGLWAMEYFANADEPGYVMLVRFSPNGSVEFSANHKWIGSTFKQEVSLWDVISDDGTVLTFNSFNKLFHIFSTPEDITGPDAPKNPDTSADINELGYGHDGDYEFQVMSHDSSVVRLVGKKRGYNIYLRHLPADTDPEAYLADVDANLERFGKKFNNLLLVDDSGLEYTLSDLATGIPSIYPRQGDAVSQTTSANGIFTATGFRFATHLTVKRPDGSEWQLTELKWQDDNSLTNGAIRVSAPSPVENLVRRDLVWRVSAESLTGQYAAAYQTAADDIVAALGKNNRLGFIDIEYETYNKALTPYILTRLGSKRCKDYISFGSATEGTEVSMSYVDSNSTAKRYNDEIPSYKALKELIFFTPVTVANTDALNPTELVVTMASDPESHFTLILAR